MAAPSTIVLSNAFYSVGVSLNQGGAISAIKAIEYTTPSNFINSWDAGRLVQQSYYGDDDGSIWPIPKAPRKWNYNPVQGGCWNDTLSTLQSYTQTASSFYGVTIPRNWAACQLCPESTMYSNYTLKDDMIEIAYSMKYTGATQKTARHQEMPAVFVDRTLYKMAFYNGTQPWTDDALQFVDPVIHGSRVGNDYYKNLSEKWVAYFNPATGIGLGVYTPTAEQVTAYRVGNNNLTPAKSDTSYFAPLMTKTLTKGVTYSYKSYIKIGTLNEIRDAFAGLNCE
jgi:hypothetical protein